MKTRKNFNELFNVLEELSVEQARKIYGGGHYEVLRIKGKTIIIYVEDRK